MAKETKSAKETEEIFSAMAKAMVKGNPTPKAKEKTKAKKSKAKKEA